MKKQILLEVVLAIICAMVLIGASCAGENSSQAGGSQSTVFSPTVFSPTVVSATNGSIRSKSTDNTRTLLPDPYQVVPPARTQLGIRARMVFLDGQELFVARGRPATASPTKIVPGGCVRHVVGARIEDVVFGSPAYRGGLELGDTIIEVDGGRLTDGRRLRQAIRASEPWLHLKVINVRTGTPTDVWVHMGVGHDLLTEMMR